MARIKTTLPLPSREKNQRSLSIEPYIDRILPAWGQPDWLDGDVWRRIVARQPIAVICRDTLISNIVSMDWKIEAVDSTLRDELKEEITYYTKLIMYTGEYDYTEMVEWVCKDLLDMPFGGIVELGRYSEPDGRIAWIKPLDGSTCFPTRNKEFPVGQALKEAPTSNVIFPDYAVSRIYMSPRTDIKREGWGMPPPEKIYLSLELLNRGDYYYANLLLDTPAAGILDLGDMEKEAAEEWIKSWRDLLTGIDPFKIPVLYQHTKSAEFIQFSRSPTEIMFDKATMKYAAILAAGYGMSLSDIGFSSSSSGGETLAGTIRQERRTKRTGFSLVKRKLKSFWDKALPEGLEFRFIDLDDETSVAQSRARLADATASAQYIDKRIFSPGELRRQAIANGLFTISLPEDVPEESEFPQPKLPSVGGGGSPERPSMLGRPVAPSSGGHGEVRQSLIEKELDKIVNIEDIRLKRLIRPAILPISVELSSLDGNSVLESDNLQTWNEWQDEVLWGNLVEDIPELTVATNRMALDEIDKVMSGDEWWIVSDFKDIIGDLAVSFSEIKLSKLKSLAEEQYELGNISKLPTYVLDTDNHFVDRLARAIIDVYDTIPGKIKKAVISGTRKYLSMQMLSGMETPQSVTNENIFCVRNELRLMENSIIQEFADVLSSIINIRLGEIKWDDDQKTIN